MTEASIRVADSSCGLPNTPSDPLEQTYAAGSALLNHGNGDYQMNWKTSTSWAGSCKVMTLDLGGGTTQQAYFKFIK